MSQLTINPERLLRGDVVQHVTLHRSGDAQRTLVTVEREDTPDEAQGQPAATEPVYPHIRVQLTGEDGNAVLILGRVMSALRRAGVSELMISEFRAEAMSGDYDHVLRTVEGWVTTL